MAAERDADAARPEAEAQASGARGQGTDAGDTNDQGDEVSSMSSTDHVQEKPPAPLTKKQKLMRHCGRFWWVYLIILIVILAIMLPLLFTVIIGRIVQNVVSSQGLPIYGGLLGAVSPTEVNMTLKTALNTPLKSKIDAMPLDLFRTEQPDSPFLTLDFPEAHVNHHTNITVEPQVLKVKNESEIIKFFSSIFDDKSVDVGVKSKPHVHLGALKYDATLDKTVNVRSLQYLPGFGVRDLEFMMPANERGYNLAGTLNLPNTGVLTLYLGNLTFNVMSGDIRLGLIHIYDVTLEPGMNNPPFEGDFYFDQLIPNLSAILGSQGKALADGDVELTATGNATTINGEHILYLEKMLNTKKLHFRIPVLTLVGDLLNGLVGSTGAGNLGDLVGGVLGNDTLIDGIVSHWNATQDGSGGGGGGGGGANNDSDNDNSNDNNNRKAKRSAMARLTGKGALAKSILRMGMRAKAKAR